MNRAVVLATGALLLCVLCATEECTAYHFELLEAGDNYNDLNAAAGWGGPLCPGADGTCDENSLFAVGLSSVSCSGSTGSTELTTDFAVGDTTVRLSVVAATSGTGCEFVLGSVASPVFELRLVADEGDVGPALIRVEWLTELFATVSGENEYCSSGTEIEGWVSHDHEGNGFYTLIADLTCELLPYVGESGGHFAQSGCEEALVEPHSRIHLAKPSTVNLIMSGNDLYNCPESGSGTSHASVELTISVVERTGVDDGVFSSAPRLKGNYPNPFNPTTTIEYELSHPTSVSLSVFSLSGRLIRRIIPTEFQDAGLHAVTWDGFDGVGRAVPSGVYFYRLFADGEALTNRMILLK